MNSDEPDIREKGKAAWIETAQKYGPYFEEIKKKLPKNFMKTFEKSSWFHDFVFSSINLTNMGKYMSIVEFQISHVEESYKITFSGVNKIAINIPTTQNWLCGNLTWGYTEFELNDDNSWSIRVLCDLDCEISLNFRRIAIVKT